MKVSLAVTGCALIATQAVTGFGSVLRQGMQLVYSSDGVDTPWSVDTLAGDTTFGGKRGCIRLRMRTSPTQTVPDLRMQCADSAMMYAWDTVTATLRATRPLTANARVEFSLSGGRKARYETGTPTKETIGGRHIDVLPTTVTTLDAEGRAVSRLRERFAISLATATGGVFEVPDMTAPEGWRVTRKFDLVAIRTP